MFPLRTPFSFATRDTLEPIRPASRPPSRLEIQRRHLEHKKMYHLDLMALDQRYGQNDRDLIRRQMIAEARQSHVSLFSRVRHSIGQALISTGERIRPEIVAVEPEFNG